MPRDLTLTTTTITNYHPYRWTSTSVPSGNPHRLKPDIVTYNTAISAAAKGTRPEDAYRLVREMEAAGVVPNLVSYNCLIDALAHTGRWKEAIEQVRDLGRASPPEVRLGIPEPGGTTGAASGAACLDYVSVFFFLLSRCPPPPSSTSSSAGTSPRTSSPTRAWCKPAPGGGSTARL